MCRCYVSRGVIGLLLMRTCAGGCRLTSPRKPFKTWVIVLKARTNKVVLFRRGDMPYISRDDSSKFLVISHSSEIISPILKMLRDNTFAWASSKVVKKIHSTLG